VLFGNQLFNIKVELWAIAVIFSTGEFVVNPNPKLNFEQQVAAW
jgi:hypothetical protein